MFYDTWHYECSYGSDDKVLEKVANLLTIEEKRDFFNKSVKYLKWVPTLDTPDTKSLIIKACILRAFPYLLKTLKHCMSGEQNDAES